MSDAHDDTPLKRPLWPLLVAVAVPVAMVITLSVIVLIVWGVFRSGSYPSPVTRYEGQTADEWYVVAMDAGPRRETGCEALGHLGSEGVPFLLRVAEAHPNDAGPALEYLNGKFVHSADLGRVAAFLDDRYSRSDRHVGYYNLRLQACRILGEAGPNAKPYLGRLKELARDSKPLVTTGKEQSGGMQSDGTVGTAAKLAIKAIEGR